MIHPAIRELFSELNRHPDFQALLKRLLGREAVQGPVASSLSGLTTTAKAAYLTLLWQTTERPLLVVAERGRLEVDRESRELHFRLARGDIHIQRDPGDAGQRNAAGDAIGQPPEQGTHQDLLAKSGVYADMWALQQQESDKIEA